MTIDELVTKPAPFDVLVEGDGITDIELVQKAFGVSFLYHDIALEEHLADVRSRFPLLAELDLKRKEE
ncbi:YhjR family protein [Aeromonas veronii]|uniref:BcsR/BcsP family cellulose biosynthesis protein n=1 Tax=Aeromonas TaxID=642 RepID=UPI001F26D7E6|nr:BcsR/BcsP family cellulose biosynthesis protein [Aeromonas veronii]MCF5907605.1 YhjR family protein [Aeromonas veronii]